jgi:hypothetical protein
MRVEVREKTDDHTIATWGRVVLLVFSRRASAQGITGVHAFLRAWAPTQVGGVVLVSVVSPQPPKPPDDETRAAMAHATANPVPGMMGAGTLYEGGGFIAASIRAMVSRLQLLRTGERLVFFRSTDEAAAWAAETLAAKELTGEGLAEAIRTVRAG